MVQTALEKKHIRIALFSDQGERSLAVLEGRKHKRSGYQPLKKAVEAQGFTDGTRGEREGAQRVNAEK